MDGRFEFPYCSPNYNVYTFHGNQPGVGEQSLFRAVQPPRVDLTGSHSPQRSETARPQSDRLIPSISLKVINPDKKSDAKLYILRNVSWQHLSSPDGVRSYFVDQLSEQVSSNPVFDFGYFQGNKRVWVRNNEDLKEVHKLLKTSDSHCVTLWCDGKADHRSAKRSVGDLNFSDSDGENDVRLPKSKSKKKRSRYEEKAERIEDTVDQLKEKHGNKYTLVQYRIWAETMESGQHSSVENPPTGRFFKSQSKTKPGSSSSVSANADEKCLTPSKVAQLRSTYIQQIKELHGLLELGAITNDHFVKQRDCLLQEMDKLSNKK